MHQLLNALACGLTFVVIREIQDRQRIRWLDISIESPRFFS